MVKAPDVTRATKAVTVCMSCEHSGQDLFLAFLLPARSAPDHLLFSVLKNPGMTKIMFNTGIVTKVLLRLAPDCAPDTWCSIRDPLLGSWLATTSQTDDISFDKLCVNHGVPHSVWSKAHGPNGEIKTKLKNASELWRRIGRFVKRPH